MSTELFSDIRADSYCHLYHWVMSESIDMRMRAKVVQMTFWGIEPMPTIHESHMSAKLFSNIGTDSYCRFCHWVMSETMEL